VPSVSIPKAPAPAQQTQAIRFDAMAVVGTHADGVTFVRHASLLRIPCTIPKYGELVPVHHIRPPLDLGLLGGKHRIYPLVAAHVVGYVADLAPHEIKGMQTWLERIDRRTPLIVVAPGTKGWTDRYLDHYVLCPPCQEIQEDKRTRTPRYYKFSCVGLVLECYKQGAKITLLDWQSPQFPKVDLKDLTPHYSEQDILAPRNRAKVGLKGAGGWQVALPGYLLYSLARSTEAIRQTPYVPASASEAYCPPSQQQAASQGTTTPQSTASATQQQPSSQQLPTSHQ